MTKADTRNKGRPFKLTPAISQRITDLVRSGNFPEVAAALAGVPRQTMTAWLAEGTDLLNRTGGETSTLAPRKQALAEFAAGMHSALAQAEVRAVTTIEVAARGQAAVRDPQDPTRVLSPATPSDWKAAAWLLERRSRARWRQVQEVEHSGVVVAAVTTESAAAAMARSMDRLLASAGVSPEELEASATTKTRART